MLARILLTLLLKTTNETAVLEL